MSIIVPSLNVPAFLVQQIPGGAKRPPPVLQGTKKPGRNRVKRESVQFDIEMKESM